MSAVLVLSDGLSNGRELIGGCGLYGRAWASRMVVHMCPCEEKRGGLGLGPGITVGTAYVDGWMDGWMDG